MDSREFSSGFDLLLNSYSRFKDFDNKENLDSIELNEYEKSFFLTKAQEELVEQFYNGRNTLGESFEETEQIRRALASLVMELPLEPNVYDEGTAPTGISKNSYFFNIPEEIWFITYEAVTVSSDGVCMDGATLDVMPVSQDEYHRVKRNPFRGANGRRALRLDLSDNLIEIVSNYPVATYYLRYVKRPQPIVLEDLPNKLTIEGEGNDSPCELPEALHQKILEGAVQMALRSKGIRARQQGQESK